MSVPHGHFKFEMAMFRFEMAMWYTHRLPLKHFLFFLCSVYKAARVGRVGGSTFSLVNTPGGVNPPTWANFLIVSRPFECKRPLKLSQVALHCRVNCFDPN